jgi:hypothetical protein
MEEVKTKKPLDTPFRQQTLKAWRPILTPRAVIFTFAIVGILFIPIGIVIMQESSKVIEVLSDGEDYGDKCCLANCTATDGTRVDMNPCIVNITLTEKMKPPIYMYYKLTNFYQNHRRYVKSRNDKQLRGADSMALDDLKVDCASFYQNVTDGGDVENAINPCGLIAWSLFNDSFSLMDPEGSVVPFKRNSDNQQVEGIAWPSDKEDKFHNAQDGSTGQNYPPFGWERQVSCDDSRYVKDSDKETCSETDAGLCYPGSGFCVEDEHFMVWMRTAGLPTFRKLYAIIDTELDAGDYALNITNGEWKAFDNSDAVLWNYYYNHEQKALFPVHGYDGRKVVVLSTVSLLGGKNPFLGYAYVFVGAVCLTLALLFFLKDRLSPRKLGDPSYITFNKKDGDK